MDTLSKRLAFSLAEACCSYGVVWCLNSKRGGETLVQMKGFEQGHETNLVETHSVTCLLYLESKSAMPLQALLLNSAAPATQLPKVSGTIPCRILAL